MAPRILLCCLLLALAGCGEEAGSSAPGGPEPVTELTVRMDPDGKGPEPSKQARITCPGDESCAAVEDLRPADFEPVGDGVGCTAQIDGPETARVHGRLDGKPVSGSFARNNGCEIARWSTIAPLVEATR